MFEEQLKKIEEIKNLLIYYTKLERSDNKLALKRAEQGLQQEESNKRFFIRYKQFCEERLYNLEEIYSAIVNLYSELNMLNNSQKDIRLPLTLAKKIYSEFQEDKIEIDANILYNSLLKDERSIENAFVNNLKKNLKTLEKLCEKYGAKEQSFKYNGQIYYVNKLLDDLDKIANSYFTYSDVSDNYTAIVDKTYQEQYNTLIEYEKMINSGDVKEVAVSLATISRDKKNLEELMKLDKCIKNINYALSKMDSNLMTETSKSLNILLKKCEQELIKRTQELSKTDYSQVYNVVLEKQRKEIIKDQIESCALLYIEQIEALKNGDNLKAISLENQINSFHLNEDDLKKAKSLAEDKIRNRDLIRGFDELEKYLQHRKEKSEANRQEEIREQVIHDLATSGWRPEGYVPDIVNGDISQYDDYEKLFMEEVDKRTQKKLSEEKAEEQLKKFGQLNLTQQDETLSSEYDEAKLNSAVEEMLFSNSNGYVPPYVIQQEIERYKKTAGLSARERAFQTLINEGRFPQNVDIDSLSDTQKDALDAQMRIEKHISIVLDAPKKSAFDEAKSSFMEETKKQRENIQQEGYNSSFGGYKKL